MKKIKLLLLLLVVASLTTLNSCKKKKGAGDEPEEQTFECLVKKTTYEDAADATENEDSEYTYADDNISKQVRTLNDASATSYTYEYFYEDAAKGLLDRIEIKGSNGDVLAKIEYTNANDLLTKRELIVKTTAGTWYTPSAWIVSYSYTGTKLSQMNIVDNDIFSTTPVPTDETGIYVFSGDNVASATWYDTADLTTPKEKYEYTYDTKKKVFSKVKTKEYPVNGVNNTVGLTYNKYGTSPTTVQRVYTYQYNSKDMPTRKEVADDRGTVISTHTYEYKDCN
jgi:hypothetical protein